MDGITMRRAVLIVEDDDVVRDFIVAVLSRGGHEALAAATAEEARRIIFARPDAENLCLVIDVVLNHDSGIALAQELVQRYPRFRVLLISGFTDEVVLNEPEDERIAFLAKPFTQHELVTALDKVCA